MKKFILILAVTFAAIGSSFAADYVCTNQQNYTGPVANQPNCTVLNCTNPNTSYFDPTYGVTFTCNYTDSSNGAGNACAYTLTYGGNYSDVSLINCSATPVVTTPINAGLIFLVIAGGGLGAFVFKKQTQNIKSIGA